MSHRVEFENALSKTDYGLIVGIDGKLKGIWIPESLEDQEIPDTIISLCIQHFGIDPSGDGHRSIIQ